MSGRWRFISLCVVFLCGPACLTSCRGIPTAELPVEPYFRVLTYNVNWGGPRKDLALEAITQANADVVCLQETNESWERYLRPKLTGVYSSITFRHSPGAGGMAIFSRRPVRSLYYGRPKAGWFAAWVLVAETRIGPVQLANVHLRPPLKEGGGFDLSTYFRTRTIRRKEVEEVYQHIDADYATIVLGDFNEGEDGGAIGFLSERGFTNALSEFDRYAKTWEWDSSASLPGKLSARLDHIMYSPSLHCLQARVIKAGASDHYPVLAVFRKKAAGNAMLRSSVAGSR